ncbi:hypothetical protein [Agromyces larvae]|uniref:Uncharacterized protein n=1 Tax=Agromyces larvae TaxID=2929802 RepID=A0ABY4C1W1_9MICO|nr:hypothetical protein [Agromyces larvae]UOE44432.1 hypothetical protein MTO99_01160 [Agromyces larvae]
MAIVLSIIDIMSAMSQPFMRSIIRIMVPHMSAQFAHIAAHRPMPSPASASAHITHACMHAERASRHSSIIDMSMPFGMSDADIAPFIMSIVMFITGDRRSRATGYRRRRWMARWPCCGPCYVV